MKDYIWYIPQTGVIRDQAPIASRYHAFQLEDTKENRNFIRGMIFRAQITPEGFIHTVCDLKWLQDNRVDGGR